MYFISLSVRGFCGAFLPGTLYRKRQMFFFWKYENQLDETMDRTNSISKQISCLTVLMCNEHHNANINYLIIPGFSYTDLSENPFRVNSNIQTSPEEESKFL